MCKMNDVRAIREKCNQYAAQAHASDSTHSVILAALVTNVKSKSKNAGMVLMNIDNLQVMAMGCSLPPSDMVVRWQGCPHEKAVRMAGRALVSECSDIGAVYADIEKGADGTRAEALEKRMLEYVEKLFPFLEWKHIGNHREKGWRDLAGYGADGNRKMLIEVKGANGRIIPRADK